MLKAQAWSAEQRVDCPPASLPGTTGRAAAIGAGMRQNSLRSESLPLSLPSKVHLSRTHTQDRTAHMVPAGSARAGPHPTPPQGPAAASHDTRKTSTCEKQHQKCWIRSLPCLGQLACKCGLVCVSSLTINSSKLQEHVNRAVTGLLLQATTERFQEA